MNSTVDEKYLALLIRRIEVCKTYTPKFGQSSKEGLSLEQFQTLYGSDPFYTWFGLDNPLVYAAHKAAGGITSVYRQIGTGGEELFRQVLQDQLGLDAAQVRWAYSIKTSADRERTLRLDARIQTADIVSNAQRISVQGWLRDAAAHLEIAPEIAAALKGAVFEVRQGYKSKDAKRQNADIANAASAYAQGYLPVVFVFSAQIDSDIALRYENAKWLVLRGYTRGTPTQSAYAFMRDVIGYDLAAFFEKYASRLRIVVADALKTLLSSER